MLFELIIFFHEGGHFVAAKKSGVKVNEFALGMGPKLFSFKKGETTYSLRLFPIGGYCAMEGEDGESDNPRAFNNVPIYKRMIIVVAGAVMNILFGLVLMLITLIPKESFTTTTVDQFVPYSYSAATGLEQGDKIVEINGYRTYTSTDFSFALYTLPLSEVSGDELSIYKEDCLYQLYSHYHDSVDSSTSQETIENVYKTWEEGANAIFDATEKEQAYTLMCEYYDKIDIAAGKEKSDSYPKIKEKETRKRYRTDMKVIRDGKEIELKNVDLFTYLPADSDEPTLSIDFYVKPLEKNFGTLLSQTFSQTVSTVRMVWGSLIGLVKGQFSINDVSGPVGLASAITDVASQSLKEGFMSAVNSIVYVMMVITVNLGIVNMLPFPALDGGRFLLLIIEAIFKKPIPRKVESVINAVGMVLLLSLMFVITVKDIWKLFSGG